MRAVMRSGAVWCAVSLAVMTARAPAAVAFAPSSVWGKAIEVPGLGALNARGYAQVSSVSCGSAGNCAAGGFYIGVSGHDSTFVISERNGRWGRAAQVPGLGAASKSGNAYVNSVSCASAGNCAAGGSSGHGEEFVAVERDGRWGAAIQVPGLDALSPGGFALVSAVSCGSAGNCAAGGSYDADPSEHQEAFVAVERNGRWGTAIEVPGLGALNTGGTAQISSVSCPSAGNCSAGGSYAAGFGTQAFVVDERNGRWGTAIEVPGSGALNKGGIAQVNAVSCASAGNCAAGGSYSAGPLHTEAFVAVERNGRWGNAIEVPGSGALNTGREAVVSSVSCGSAGSCAAGGRYQAGFGVSSRTEAFVAVERNGQWGTAIEVPGSGALNGGGAAAVTSVSCPAAGTCAAGGYFRGAAGQFEAFVATERNGRWGSAIKVPGSRALNVGGNAQVSSISCASADSCAAAGTYRDGSGAVQGFVASQT